MEIARVRPVRDHPTAIIAQFHHGTVRRTIETDLAKIRDGRTFRQILDGWLGPEPRPRARAPILGCRP